MLVEAHMNKVLVIFAHFSVLFRLFDKLKDAQGSKKLIADEIKTKQEYLDSLQPKLNSILQVCIL